MTRPILNVSDVELKPRPAAFAPTGAAAGKFDARVGFIAPLVGAQKLGYNLTAVPPGKRAFPFHNHRVNEEMFLIIEGEGEVRIGDAVYPIRQGDIIFVFEKIDGGVDGAVEFPAEPRTLMLVPSRCFNRLFGGLFKDSYPSH